MYKNHAKRLAGERVEYWYLKDAIQISDSLVESCKERLSSALVSIEGYKEKEQNHEHQIEMYSVLLEGYKTEVGMLTGEVDSLRKKEFWIVLTAVLSLVASAIVFN